MTNSPAKDDLTWENLAAVHDSIITALKNSSTNLMGVYSTKGLAQFIRGDKNEVRVSMYGIARDRKYFDKELKEIAKQYEGRTGPIGQGDELDEEVIADRMLALQINEQYAAVKTKMELILQPVTNMLLGFAADAANRMSAYQIQATVEQNRSAGK
jgi:hypothetical protein